MLTPIFTLTATEKRGSLFGPNIYFYDRAANGGKQKCKFEGAKQKNGASLRKTTFLGSENILKSRALKNVHVGGFRVFFYNHCTSNFHVFGSPQKSPNRDFRCPKDTPCTTSPCATVRVFRRGACPSELEPLPNCCRWHTSSQKFASTLSLN